MGAVKIGQSKRTFRAEGGEWEGACDEVGEHYVGAFCGTYRSLDFML